MNQAARSLRPPHQAEDTVDHFPLVARQLKLSARACGFKFAGDPLDLHRGDGDQSLAHESRGDAPGAACQVERFRKRHPAGAERVIQASLHRGQGGIRIHRQPPDAPLLLFPVLRTADAHFEPYVARRFERLHPGVRPLHARPARQFPDRERPLPGEGVEKRLLLGHEPHRAQAPLVERRRPGCDRGYPLTEQLRPCGEQGAEHLPGRSEIVLAHPQRRPDQFRGHRRPRLEQLFDRLQPDPPDRFGSEFSHDVAGHELPPERDQHAHSRRDPGAERPRDRIGERPAHAGRYGDLHELHHVNLDMDPGYTERIVSRTRHRSSHALRFSIGFRSR